MRCFKDEQQRLRSMPPLTTISAQSCTEPEPEARGCVARRLTWTLTRAHYHDCCCIHVCLHVRRLSRNVLGHTKPWDREAGSKLLDVGVIEALPGALGQSLFEFNEAMVGALRLLSRCTVQAAAAAFSAELSGGGIGGGSIDEGSGEDDSSSGSGLSGGARGSSGGGLRSATGGAGSTSSGDGHGRSSSGGGRGSSSGGRGRGAGALPDHHVLSHRAGPAAAGCGHRPPLVYATGGSHGRWGHGEQRAPTLAPRLRVRLPLFAPAAAAAVGPRLPCW